MHPVDIHKGRKSKYIEHVRKYDFSSLHFSVPPSSIGSFATTNNIPVNVYGVDGDEKVIYPLRVSSTLVPDRHVDLRNGIQLLCPACLNICPPTDFVFSRRIRAGWLYIRGGSSLCNLPT